LARLAANEKIAFLVAEEEILHEQILGVLPMIANDLGVSQCVI
jgi:hypothetical protein